MKASALSSAVAVAALSSCAHAVFTMNIQRNPEITNLRKRGLQLRSTITESLNNNATGGDYIAKVNVGTPAQSITLAIDTGSSDVWLMDVSADLCVDPSLQAQNGRGGCSSTYDPSKSSTYQIVAKGEFDISYADQSGAQGDYISDVLSIGGATIKTLEMGLAHKATLPTGLLGIGYDVNEASDGLTDSFVYPSIIDTMVAQNLIATKAYSLYLDDLESSTGSIIFGGLDSDKFQGSLVQLDVVPAHFKNGTAIYAELAVNVTAISVTGEAGNTTAIPDVRTFVAVLDSGTSLTYIPDDTAAELFSMIGAYDDTANSGQVFVDCNIAKNSPGQTFNFGFSGTETAPLATIKVPMTEMIFPLTGLFETPASYIPPTRTLGFSSVCALGVQPGGTQVPLLLGDTFLRSAYVVYDLTNNLIGIAQTNFNSTKTTITEFSATQTALPVVTGVGVTNSVAAKKSGAGMVTSSLVAAFLGVGTAFVILL